VVNTDEGDDVLIEDPDIIAVETVPPHDPNTAPTDVPDTPLEGKP
jgi:hypothetical protein